ncbi:MAG: 50S ribosomal protein L23 [Thermomicrobiales bacterium]|nr:50S ribosomal protein L23 [Thermomicrobiales bacterium]
MHQADVLVRPMITEKNTRISELGQYTFEVARDANKIQIKQAVEAIFNVKVKAVNIIVMKPKKRKVMRQRNQRVFGYESSFKKAIVSLEPGHSIDVFGDL